MSKSLETGKIIAPWEFEKLCFYILKIKPKLSCLVVQMIAECSMFGHNWVRCIDVYKRLGRNRKNESVGKLISTSLLGEVVNIKKVKMHSAIEANIISLSTNVDTVDINSPDGKIMLKICNVLKVITNRHTDLSTYLPLILLCIYRFKYRRTSEISGHLGLSRSNPSMVPKIVGYLSEYGVVDSDRIAGGLGSKLIVTEVEGW